MASGVNPAGRMSTVDAVCVGGRLAKVWWASLNFAGWKGEMMVLVVLVGSAVSLSLSWFLGCVKGLDSESDG